MSNLSPFGGGKNPPWVRNAGQGIQNIQQQMLGQAMGSIGGQPMVQYQQQTQQVYQQSLGLQQPNIAMASMATLGSNLPSGIAGQLYPQVATVSYPTPRTLNSNAFQQSVTGVAQQVQQNVSASSTKQRVFTGTVTKVHDNFGFVDEDVFFQTNACVKGSNPVVGDRVLVEASYNPSMPFKWNATRIQVLPMGNNNNNTGGGGGSSGGGGIQQQSQQLNRQQQTSRQSGTYNAVPPPNDNASNRFVSNNLSNNAASSRNKVARVRERSPRERRNEDDEVERKRRREERIREREKKEERSPSRTRRSKSPRPRRRTRVVPRYMVQIPKIALDLPEADVLEVRRRYQNMYIPSDFFSTNFRWVDAFPPHMPFTLNKPCTFHVMHKDVDPCIENNAILEPPDADYLFSAKVMLMSMPAMEEIYKRCCGVTEDRDSDRDYVHPTRLINFLVGLRGKNETMAIGGPWSPSLDGASPERDPSVLIKTAVRTCKALTGIDLSHCTQWYRFLELYYRRAETTHKSGRVVPSRVETVILFLPDVWSCVPTRLEWDSLHVSYKKQLERKMVRAVSNSDDVDPTNDADEAADDTTPEKKDPTHYSELDPKSMNVTELRQELAARNLSSKGLKSQLLARLTKAIKSEQAKEEGRQDEADDNEEDVTVPVKDELKEEKKIKEHDDDKKKNVERERVLMEKRYALPESSHIIVHPSRTAKSGKFDCTLMSLSVLLDYRPEDTKEHSFEVSLFAELFNEMLMRDFGFRIYRGLCALPEKVKDKDDDKKKDKKDERRDEKKDEKRREDDKKNSKKEDKKKETIKDKKEDKDLKHKPEDRDKDEDDEDDDEESEDDDSLKDGKRDKDKDGKKKKVKLYTYDPYLLLSFVYFDQTHCGYIFDKDIEELIYTLGLNLSRAQVRKLVQKVVTRDSLHYRKLTDKSRDEDGKEIRKDDEDNEKADGSCKTEDDEEISRSLALGNKKLLPVFVGSGPVSKRARGEISAMEQDELIPDGFVMYKGSLLDVEKLVTQLKRSEKARLDTEARMMEIQHDFNTVNDKSSKQSSTIKDISEDLKIYKDKLRTSEEKLKKISSECYTYLSTLKNVYHTTSKVIQGDTKKVEIVEIQDEKATSEFNGSQECKSKSDTRWSDSKNSVKKESIDGDKEKKYDTKCHVKKELSESEKEKK
ncbi:hypothetical protein PV326_002719 [Microctonus aethiopoides]|nr:hypothetical protein PV326_002719 [Microctonus aethiopoides]